MGFKKCMQSLIGKRYLYTKLKSDSVTEKSKSLDSVDGLRKKLLSFVVWQLGIWTRKTVVLNGLFFILLFEADPLK